MPHAWRSLHPQTGFAANEPGPVAGSFPPDGRNRLGINFFLGYDKARLRHSVTGLCQPEKAENIRAGAPVGKSAQAAAWAAFNALERREILRAAFFQ